MPDVKAAYAASSDLTVTNLHSLPTSATWVAGWQSGEVDNSSNKYLDYLVSAKITVAAAGVAAGQIRLYVIGMLDDATWPDVIDATESVETFTDTEMRDAVCKLAAVSDNDGTASDVYFLGPVSVAQLFGGICPAKFVIFITHSSGANLAASGNQVTVKGTYLTVG